PQPDVNLTTVLATFADDVCVTHSSSCKVTAAEGIQQYATTFAQLAKRWNIGINSAKSVNVCFTLRRETPPAITIDGNPVLQADSAKYLGVILDRRLTFSKQVTAIRLCVRAATGKHFWLLYSRSKLSLANKVTIYKQIIAPIWR
ncbi:hypothetical protein KR222_008869, partial [Zaprionus bogoriensis]